MRNIQISMNQEKGLFPSSIQNCVGAGRANELLRKAALDQLEETHRECGFRYLRFHGLLHEDMGVYDEKADGTPIYNFQYIDMLYDEILRIGMKPFVELSYMPQAMASGTQLLFWWKTNVSPPKDYKKWGMLIYRLTEHWLQRYGEQEVSSWYFEIWNEPNHPSFFSGTMEEYFRMYDEAARAIKSVSSSFRVGGPASAGLGFIPQLIAHCAENYVPLDFISTHLYGVEGDFDEFGVKQLYLVKNDNSIADGLRLARKQIRESAMPQLELHITEWSSSYSSRDAIHDSYIEASYILYNLKRCCHLADSLSYWTFTDIFEEVGIGPEPFHGGFGLMNMQSIKKPAYHAYAFLHQLGPVELECADENTFACKTNGNQGTQILFWSYQRPEQDAPNQIYFRRDLPIQERGEDVTISISGLEPGYYRFRHYQTGYGIQDPYTEYLKAENNLEDFQSIEHLRRCSDGSCRREEIVEVGKTGVWKIAMKQRMYDCQLVTLEKI